MPIKFPRTLNPKAITPALLTTDRARAAYDRLTDAIKAHDTVEDRHQAALHKHNDTMRAYRQTLTDTAVAGDDTSKVKHPTAYDPAPAEAQLAAHRDAAIAAAAELKDALTEALPTAYPALLDDAEKAEQTVRKTAEAFNQALIDYDGVQRRLGFFRTLELHPDYLPLGGEPTARHKKTIDTIVKGLTHRADNLEHQRVLLGKRMRNTDDDNQFAALSKELNEASEQLRAEKRRAQ